MEGVVVEREGLVEGGDFVDNGKGKHQNAVRLISLAIEPGRKEVVCGGRGGPT